MALNMLLPQLNSEHLARHTRFPKKSTVDRAGFALDSAFLMCMKDVWRQAEWFHYGWADSSPQAGREWLMMMHASVRSHEVVSACTIANRLTRSRPDLQDHFESEDVDIEDLSTLHKELLNAITHHKCVPVALGSGKVSLEDKVACVLHSMSFECSDLRALQSHLSNIISWTTDLGTESKLPSFHTAGLANVLPCYMSQQLESDLLDDEPEPERQEVPQSIMPNAVLTAGALHILHNASQDLHEKMAWWPQFWGHLKAVADLLVPQHTRDRLIVRCVQNTAAAGQEHVFRKLSLPALYEKRWQVVIKFLMTLLPRFQLVKQVWDLAKFLIDGKDADGDVGASFQSALSSPLFCSYLFMVHGLHSIISNFENWLEGCSCHEHLFQNLSSKRQRSKRGKLFGGARFADCPMRGKRSSELAAGRVEETISDLTRTALNVFSKQIDDRISEDDRSILLMDFEFAKTHLHFVLVAKFDFWQKIPWRLCGISHHWPSVGRHIAKECIAEFDESMRKVGMLEEHHHPTSRHFLAQDAPLRQDIEAFAAGGSMSEPLQFAASKLKFIPVVERVAEALHRDVKVASKHNIKLGPTKVSLAVRLREIMQRSADPAFSATLQKYFDVTRHPKDAAASLNIFNHPALVSLRAQGCVDTPVWIAAVAKIVHRCDLGTQFADMSQARTFHQAKRKVETALAEALHDNAARPTPRTYETIFKRAISDHFRASATSDSFFSLPGAECFELLPLLSNAQKRQRVSENPEDLGIVVEGAVVPRPDRGDLYFRLLHGSPSRLKSMPMPVAASPVFSKDACVIAVHNIDALVEGKPQLNMTLGCQPQILEALESCSLDALRNDFKVWELSPSIKYVLPDLAIADQTSVMPTVTHLVTARALPDGEPVRMDALPLATVQSLFQAGYLERFVIQNHGHVALSEAALPKLQVVGDLQKPLSVCSIVSKNISEYSLMELLIALEDKGWVWKALPAAKASRQALRYERGKPLEFYSQSHMINRSYLQCLLMSESLFEKGVVSIPHWTKQPFIVYPQILQGKTVQDVPGPLPLEADIDQPVLGDHHVLEVVGHGAGEVDDSGDLGADNTEVDDSGDLGADNNDMGHVEAHDPPAQGPPVEEEAPAVEDILQAEAEAVEKPPSDDSDSDVPRLGRPSAWGPFRLTVKQPSASAGRAYGGIEATCPFHRKNKKTGCKKYLQLRSSTQNEFDLCLRSLKAWCNAATTYNRQRDHLAHFVSAASAPIQEVLDAGFIRDGPSDRPADDDELDAAEGAVPAPKPKAGRGRGRAARGRPAPAARGRGRAHGRGRQGLLSKLIESLHLCES